jgi:hypothetical protein
MNIDNPMVNHTTLWYSLWIIMDNHCQGIGDPLVMIGSGISLPFIYLWDFRNPWSTELLTTDNFNPLFPGGLSDTITIHELGDSMKFFSSNEYHAMTEAFDHCWNGWPEPLVDVVACVLRHLCRHEGWVGNEYSLSQSLHNYLIAFKFPSYFLVVSIFDGNDFCFVWR